MNADDRRARAIRFHAALENGVLNEAMDDLEQQFTAEWKVASTVEERENLFRTVRILNLLRSHMAAIIGGAHDGISAIRSEEHTSELQSLMRISYAVFCLKKKKT